MHTQTNHYPVSGKHHQIGVASIAAIGTIGFDHHRPADDSAKMNTAHSVFKVDDNRQFAKDKRTNVNGRDCKTAKVDAGFSTPSATGSRGAIEVTGGDIGHGGKQHGDTGKQRKQQVLLQ